MKDFKYSDFSGRLSRDLSCYTCGIERCSQGHSYGPTVRSGYLFYLILEGEGIFQIHNNVYKMHPGEGFLIIPNNLVRFEASLDNPWTYLWIGLTGSQIDNYLQNTSINEYNPVFRFKMNDEIYKYAEKVIITYQRYPYNTLKLTSNLYRFLDIFCTYYPSSEESNKHKNDRDILESAVHIINNNYYYNELTIDSISAQLHINRSCLYRIFKARLGQSPQQYLIQYRLDRAKDLIENKDLPLNLIANSVGYKDPLSFSREFKHKIGISPSEYKKIYCKV